MRGGGARQHDGEAGASALAVVDGDGAGVACDDLADDGQPQAEAGHPARLPGTVEALERVQQILGVDPRTLVVDGEHAGRDPHRHPGLGRAPLRGVVEQVGDRALHRRGLADNPPRRQGGVEGQAGARRRTRTSARSSSAGKDWSSRSAIACLLSGWKRATWLSGDFLTRSRPPPPSEPLGLMN